MQSVANRRYCFNILVVVLVILSAVTLNVLYALAKNFAALHREFWTQYTNHSHRHVAVWPSGYFPHNTYGFHPINEHGVRCTLLTCVLLMLLGDIFRENSRKVITPTRYLP